MDTSKAGRHWGSPPSQDQVHLDVRIRSNPIDTTILYPSASYLYIVHALSCSASPVSLFLDHNKQRTPKNHIKNDSSCILDCIFKHS